MSQSPNEKKVRQYVKALLTMQNLKSSDREYFEKVDSAIRRGSLNSRVFKDLMKEIAKNSSSISEIMNSFKRIIDDVYLIERENYDISNSLNQPEIIVLTECYVKED